MINDFIGHFFCEETLQMIGIRQHYKTKKYSDSLFIIDDESNLELNFARNPCLILITIRITNPSKYRDYPFQLSSADTP